MKPKNKTRRDGRAEESALITLLEIKQVCGRELAKLQSLVKKPSFGLDLKTQEQVMLILRGMAIKMGVIRADRQQDLEEFSKIIEGLVRQFGSAWERKSLNVQLTGEDGGPLEMVTSVKGQINLQGLRDAIKRDQER